MTETQQRFLRAIAERVPKEQVVEVHLFPAIRQGGVETGVAVVAERPHVADPEPAASNGQVAHEESEAPLIDPGFAAALATDSPEAEAFAAQHGLAPSTSDAEVAIDAEPAIEAEVIEADAAVETETVVEPDAIIEADAAVETETTAEGDTRRESSARSRLTVYTARYRLTLKGVDRGKWEVDVVAEADAPLSAVDAVVRGVQRRAGEGAEPDRLTAEAFRDALEAPLATLER
jgi:hypothetical protein